MKGRTNSKRNFPVGLPPLQYPISSVFPLLFFIIEATNSDHTLMASQFPSLIITIICITIILQSQIPKSNSQQQYVNNNQLDCYNNYPNTNGFLCNGNRSSCTAYLTFRSKPPIYSTPPNIAFLLDSDPSALAQLNNISDVDPIPANRLILVPITCTCPQTQTQTRNKTLYYKHSANYTIKVQGETYYSISNITYQGLTTCQSMIAQNKYDSRNLTVADQLTVPLMCACPTTQQQTLGAKYLVSYLVSWGDDISKIAAMFGVDMKSVLDANELKPDDVIYPFTPILVPLKSVPTKLNLPSPPPAPTPPPKINPTPVSKGSSKKWVYVGVAIGAGILVVCFCSVFAWFCLLRPSRKSVPPLIEQKEKGKKKDPVSSSEYTAVPGSYTSSSQTQDTKSWSVDLDDLKHTIGSLTVYKYSELDKATGKFSEVNRIKGSVFRGIFNGDDAAVKILHGIASSDEIKLLKHINHSNIIRLSGYGIHEGNTYLVYEFAEKGSLDDWLFNQQKHQSEDNSISQPVLGWKQRIRIACHVADALNYLHNYVDPPYIHKNLKSSNVILDSSYRAKITNFGLARAIQDTDEDGMLHLTKHVVGTQGYLAPEYMENGVVTSKLDVFAFGVVLLEILSGKPAVRPSGNNKGGTDDLLFMVIGNVFEGEDIRGKLMSFMDYNLGREYPLDLAYSMAQLAHKCVDRDMNSRPSMSEVSMTLSKIYSSSLDWDPSDELANSSSFSHSQ